MLVAVAVLLGVVGALAMRGYIALSFNESVSEGSREAFMIVLLVIASSCWVAATICFGLGIVRWALRPYQGQAAKRSERLEAVLQLISETVMVSETAKRIAFREGDRQTLRNTI